METTEKKAEEAKRERAWDPAARWAAVLDMIAWSETVIPPQERRNQPRYHRPDGRGCVFFKKP